METTPAIFKDSAGREWPLKLTVDSCERVFQLTEGKVDLYAVSIDWPQTNPRLALLAIAALCHPECERRNVTAEQFSADISDPDVIISALRALGGALANFSPSQLKETRHKITQKIDEVINLQGQREQQLVSDGILDKAIQADLDRQDKLISELIGVPYVPSSGSSPDNSNSTPAT